MASFDVPSKPSWLKGTSISIFKLPIIKFVSDISEHSFDVKIAINENQLNNSSDMLSTEDESQRSEPMVVSSIVPTCIACGLVFDSRLEQVEHFKSDYHRLKLLERIGDDIETDKQISQNTNNSDESDDDDNDEQNEDEDKEDTDGIAEEMDDMEQDFENINEKGCWLRQGHPTVCFSNKKQNKNWAVELNVSLFAKTRKELLYSESDVNIIKPSLYSLMSKADSQSTWCIILMRSGRFAAGIYQGDTLVKHKVFKRYTTRRGQGGSQASMDASGNDHREHCYAFVF